MEEIVFGSARSLAAKIRAGHISSRESLDLFVAQIARHNGNINAVVWTDYEAARVRAGEADEATARGQNWGPLHGVPMTIKEHIDIEGAPTTRGAEEFRDNVATKTAESAQHLMNAGAVIFGKSNVPRLLADWQTYNDIYGITRNPHDLTRSPGGSSGGSSAAMAAGFSAMEFGSDGGGSIRIPAHFCGVTGHKSSFGIISKIGAGLSNAPTESDTSVMGPIARHAEDLALALDITAKPSAHDACAYSLTLPRSRHSRLKDYRIAVKLDDPMGALDNGYRRKLDELVSNLARSGAKLAQASPNLDFAYNDEVYTRMIRSATSVRYDDAELQGMADMLAGLPDGDPSYAARSIRATLMSHRDWLFWNARRQELRGDWHDFFRDWDVLICPVFPTPAFPMNFEPSPFKKRLPLNGEERPFVEFLFWPGIPNGVYLPSTCVPIGRTDDTNLPVGVQIIGPYLHDHTTIELARLIEQEFGGYTQPDLVLQK